MHIFIGRNSVISKNIRIERCSGAALQPCIPELARLRFEVFREFPYLYDGILTMKKIPSNLH
jgi:hypothetical protein